MIQDVNSSFSPDQSVLNFCSTATRSQRRRRKSRLPRYPPRPVYESSFWASKKVYEMSDNRTNRLVDRSKALCESSAQRTSRCSRACDGWLKFPSQT